MLKIRENWGNQPGRRYKRRCEKKRTKNMKIIKELMNKKTTLIYLHDAKS